MVTYELGAQYCMITLFALQVQFHEAMDTMAVEMSQYYCLTSSALEVRPACSIAHIRIQQPVGMTLHMQESSVLVSVAILLQIILLV